MELTKQDTQKAKGVAIIGMVMLHLFCRLGNLPYVPLIWIGKTPLIYYMGLFGDFCVPIFCFCSGYAHHLLKDKYQDTYLQTVSKKLLRFISNYWIVVVMFVTLGFMTGNSSIIPGTLSKFLGNIFLYRLNYNGAWWFVVTYIFLSVLSPLLFHITNKMNSLLLIGISGVVYFISYLFRFDLSIEIPNAMLAWIWQQLVLLGTSQFSYLIGMVCRKKRWISTLRTVVCCENSSIKRYVMRAFVLSLPMGAFIGHCFVQSLIVAPITATAVLLCLFCIRLPAIVDRFLFLMGKHSNNIWLVHMFFYLTLFENFVFIAKYPLFVFILMIIVCLITSWFIVYISRVIGYCFKCFM